MMACIASARARIARARRSAGEQAANLVGRQKSCRPRDRPVDRHAYSCSRQPARSRPLLRRAHAVDAHDVRLDSAPVQQPEQPQGDVGHDWMWIQEWSDMPSRSHCLRTCHQPSAERSALAASRKPSRQRLPRVGTLMRIASTASRTASLGARHAQSYSAPCGGLLCPAGRWRGHGSAWSPPASPGDVLLERHRQVPHALGHVDDLVIVAPPRPAPSGATARTAR